MCLWTPRLRLASPRVLVAPSPPSRSLRLAGLGPGIVHRPSPEAPPERSVSPVPVRSSTTPRGPRHTPRRRVDGRRCPSLRGGGRPRPRLSLRRPCCPVLRVPHAP